jgi:hypothetical protein
MYYELNGKSFDTVLREFNLSFTALLSRLPDVCRFYFDYNGDVVISRVSNEETSHMDHLTITKKKKKKT